MNTSPTAQPPRARLWAELCLLFIGAPALMAIFFEEIQAQRLLFGLIWALTLVAIALLAMTPGWRWKTLLRGPVLGEWRLILAFTALVAGVCYAVVMATAPGRLFSFPLQNTQFWLLVMVAYPILSAAPQELIYRSLFFERYGRLFPGEWAAILANGALFGFGHLFYESWITIAMTAAGGAIMGWAYLRGRSVLLAFVLHAVAGQLIFTFGLGIYFYSGAVGR